MFSYGSYPPGPVRLDEREPEALTTARFGSHLLSAQDIVFGDDDDVLFVAAEQVDEVLATAHQICQTEREQARRIRSTQAPRTRSRRHRARSCADHRLRARNHALLLGRFWNRTAGIDRKNIGNKRVAASTVSVSLAPFEPLLSMSAKAKTSIPTAIATIKPSRSLINT